MEKFKINAQYFEFLVFLIVLAILTISVIQDVKTRLIDGRIWLILILLSIPLNLIRLLLYWNNGIIIIFILLSIIFGIVFSLMVGYFGLWGEADVLALISISLAIPLSLVQVIGINGMALGQDISILLPLSITLIMNASLIQLPLPIFIFLNNIRKYRTNKYKYLELHESTYKKISACFLGEPLLISSILNKPIWFYQVLEKSPNFNPKYDLNSSYPVPFIRLKGETLNRWSLYKNSSFELIQPNYLMKNYLSNKHTQKREWRLDFSIGLKSEEEDLYRQRTVISDAINDRKKNFIWVQYSVPFLLPLTLGLILSFFQINLLFTIFKFF